MIFFFLLLCIQGIAHLDLESNAQDFVLETRRIEVPEFPHAFNPSLVRWQGRLLLSFRIIPDIRSAFTSLIGLIWLDEQFRPEGTPQFLQMRSQFSPVPSRAEDARLIVIGERLYIIYSDNEEPVLSAGGFRMYVAELAYDRERFYFRDCEKLAHFPGESSLRREKNWVPFEYNQELFLAYSINPHLIFSPLFGSEGCDSIASTSARIEWTWGSLRGGTPALQLENGEYLAFFHSSVPLETVHSCGRKILHYLMGAYTFSGESPFYLKRISSDPIVGQGFYSGPKYIPYWKPLLVVFPGGFIMDEETIWLVYGKQDHEMWLAKIDKKALLSSLSPLNQ